MAAVSPRNTYSRHFPLPRRVVDREGYILALCAGKRVLHVGCAASRGYDAAIRDGTWLHGKLQRVAREAVGVDVAREAVRDLQERHGVGGLFVGDAEHLEALDLGRFDLVLAGELIEHLACPGSFLRSAHAVLEPRGVVLITTSNAHCARRFLRVLAGTESVHEDHVAYYSHSTLRSLAGMCGYRVVEQLAYALPNRRPLLPWLFERVCCALAPNAGEGIICLLERDPSQVGATG